jgi:hypothetical protein
MTVDGRGLNQAAVAEFLDAVYVGEAVRGR